MAMKFISRILAVLAVSLGLLAVSSCNKEPGAGDTPVIEARYTISPTTFTGAKGESFSPVLTKIADGKRSTYDFKLNPDGLKTSSTNIKVATVDAACKVTLTGAGKCNIKLNSADGKEIASIAIDAKDVVFREPDFTRTLASGLLFGQYLLGGGNGNNPQCIDVDRNGNVWLEGVTGNTVFLQRFKTPGQFNASTGVMTEGASDQAMKMYYAGHGTTLAVETTNDPAVSYIWYSNFASKTSSGGYQDSQIISRTKYLPGTTIYPEDADEHFYLGAQYATSFQYVDFEYGHLAVFTPGISKLTIFNLKDILAAPVKSVTLTPVLWGGDTSRYGTEKTLTLSVNAHDCSGVTPLKQFSVTKKQAMKSGSCQGFCCTGENADCYFLLGDSTDKNVALTKVNGVTGEYEYIGKEMAFDDDIPTLASYNITTEHYLEAEGVTVRYGKMYICVASKMSGKRISSVLLLN